MSRATLESLALLLVLIVALVLRLHHLDRESLFMDELRQVSYYGSTLKEIVVLAASQNQPPLDYWIGALAARLSNNDFMVRLPSAAFGVGAVWLIIILARRLSPPPVALLVGASLALNPFHIYFSQEARPYSIAIFFFLAVLLTSRPIWTKTRCHWWQFALFGFACLGFLLSRTLSPIAAVSSVGLLMAVTLAMRARQSPAGQGAKDAPRPKELALGLLTIAAAVAVYVPYFVGIYTMGQRYLATDRGFAPHQLIDRLDAFTLWDPWKVAAVQLEPLGPVLGALASWGVLALILTRRSFAGPFPRMLAWLLPLSTAVHYLAFRIMTDMTFRPPYAVYLLPLVLLLAAWALGDLWARLARLPFRRWCAGAAGAGVLAMLALQVAAVADFKSMQRKPDWRGVARHLSASYGPETLLVFLTLEPANHWVPVFYGFPRYYSGTSPGRDLPAVMAAHDQLVGTRMRPVLVVFHYNAYRMTSRSRYPFIEAIRVDPFNWRTEAWPAGISVREFVGFTLIAPGRDLDPEERARTGELLHALLDGLIAAAPDDSALVAPHLAAALYTSAGEDQHRARHLRAAKRLARPDQIPMLEEMEMRLRETRAGVDPWKHQAARK